MLILILLAIIVGVFTPICVLCFKNSYKFDCETFLDIVGFVSGLIALLSATVLLVASVSLIGLKSTFKVEIEKYNNTVELVESYKNCSDNSNCVFEYDLRKDILEINNTIAKHKVWRKNKWFSLWYSEEIGNLEPIKYDFHKKQESAKNTNGDGGETL